MNPRILVLLVLAGCATEPAVAPNPEAPLESAFARIDADARAFRRGEDGALWAHLDRLGLRGRLAPEGLVASSDSGGAVSLRTLSWGLDRPTDAGPATPALGACTEEVDATGACIPRAELDFGGVVEWWASTPAGLEQGWDVSRPAGEGETLTLTLQVSGAAAAGEGDALELTDSTGLVWRYAGLRAEDAAGRALPARLVGEGDRVLVKVDVADAEWPVHVDPLLTTSSVTLTGESTQSFGKFVSNAGDLNGDGIDDVVIGAPDFDDGSTTNCGKVYVFFGSSSGLSSGVGSDADAIITGETASAYMGFSVRKAGNVNNDAYGDLVIGAYGASTGRVYVLHGGASGPGSGAISAVADTTISGEGSSQSFGEAVAGVGDINGDGYDDIATGAAGYDAGSSLNVGRAYIFHGSASGVTITSASSASRVITGSSAQEGFGSDVNGAGDVNADGYDDVVVGAELYDSPASNAGRAYVFHGSASGVSTSSASSANSVMESEGSSTNFGNSVASAGDVNGDGYSDVVVGAEGYDSGSSSNLGRVYVFRGSASGVVTTATATITGDGSSGYFGTSVSSAGDVNGDGYDDVIAGAYGYDVGGLFNLGRAYLFLGGSSGITASGVSSASVTITGAGSSYYLGASVGGGGDFNADGFSDVVVGAYNYSSGIGRVYVIEGCGDCDGDGSLATADCDDNDAGRYPGNAEVVNDGIDQDCSGGDQCYEDADGDSFGSTNTIASADLDCTDSGEANDQDDCDDSESGVNPNAVEICDEDDTDEDCSGAADDNDGSVDNSTYTTWYADADSDGFGDPGNTADSCDAPSGFITDSTDCDDSDALINPDGAEVCDGADADEDCNGLADNEDGGVSSATLSQFYTDDDGDGFGLTDSPVMLCDAIANVSVVDGDCDDSNASANPAEAEICDEFEVDENCDGLADDNDGTVDRSTYSTWYADTDGDSFGDANNTALACHAPANFLDDDQDCDDTDASIHPGAMELCDASDTDEDCDGQSDDQDASVDASTFSTFYADSDSDGYGDAGEPTETCDAPSGYVNDDQDCDDDNPQANPGASEVCDPDDVDEDCNGQADDGDGGVDASTYNTFYADADSDGYGDATSAMDACDASSGYVGDAGDCDDGAADVHPDATEVCDDADTDEDCDGDIDDADADVDSGSYLPWYEDLDGDGYGDAATAACAPPSGFVADGGDCDDTNLGINPGATEVCDASDVDEDCDGAADDADASVDSATFSTFYSDGDGDGYGVDSGAVSRCDTSAGLAAAGGDCDDSSTIFHPGAAESCTDTVDYNCDGSVGYMDEDADGFPACEECDDRDPAINPEAEEICDELDNDCSGVIDGADAVDAVTWYTDGDGDGYGTDGATIIDCDQPANTSSNSSDCDDTTALARPGLTEDCDDGLDNDCNGDIDAADVACGSTDDTGPDDSNPPDDSGVDDSGPDDSGVDDSGADDSGPDDTGTDGKDKDCGCASTGSGASYGLWALGLALFARRRLRG